MNTVKSPQDEPASLPLERAAAARMGGMALELRYDAALEAAGMMEALA